jgi:hypothetical protein
MAVEDEDIRGARWVAPVAVIEGQRDLAAATESTGFASERRSPPRVERVVE